MENETLEEFSIRRLRAEVAELRKDKARLDMLEKRGVQSIYFNDGGQMNPASLSLRAALDLGPLD